MGQRLFHGFLAVLGVVFLLVAGEAFGADYFDTPSSDNNFEVKIENIDEPVIRGLLVEDVRLVSDPYSVLASPDLSVEDNQPREVGPYEQTTFTINDLDFDFEKVETKEQCEASEWKDKSPRLDG